LGPQNQVSCPLLAAVVHPPHSVRPAPSERAVLFFMVLDPVLGSFPCSKGVFWGYSGHHRTVPPPLFLLKCALRDSADVGDVGEVPSISRARLRAEFDLHGLTPLPLRIFLHFSTKTTFSALFPSGIIRCPVPSFFLNPPLEILCMAFDLPTPFFFSFFHERTQLRVTPISLLWHRLMMVAGMVPPFRSLTGDLAAPSKIGSKPSKFGPGREPFPVTGTLSGVLLFDSLSSSIASFFPLSLDTFHLVVTGKFSPLKTRTGDARPPHATLFSPLKNLDFSQPPHISFFLSPSHRFIVQDGFHVVYLSMFPSRTGDLL